MEQTLKFLFSRVKKTGLSKEQIESKVCQEIFIIKVGSSPSISKRIAFKGGLILDSLSNGKRGYTKDIDFDLIKYPLSSFGLKNFIDEINETDVYKNIKISIIKEEILRHKNYQGTRLTLSFDDCETVFNLIVDIGVYKPIIKHNIFYNYEVAFGGFAQILINPIERMVAEKISTFAIFGTDNTRYKDLFDAYFLINKFEFDTNLVCDILSKILVTNSHYFNNISSAMEEIIFTISNKKFIDNLKRSNRNWTMKSIFEIIDCVSAFLKRLIR